MNDNLVSELICTRLSHDIIGNIGAVANAVELLEEGDMDFIDDIKSILSVSSKTLSARLKFFRLTFGLNNANLENKETVIKTAQDYLLTLGNKNFPINLNFNVNTPDNVKNALMMIMVMGDILIRGGDIYVEETEKSLIIKIDKSSKLSNDKLEKIVSYLSKNNSQPEAGLAHIIALCEYNKNRTFKLLQDDTYITLIME